MDLTGNLTPAETKIFRKLAQNLMIFLSTSAFFCTRNRNCKLHLLLFDLYRSLPLSKIYNCKQLHPIVVLGLSFKDFIKMEARELWVIGIALIVLAVFLYLAERLSSRNHDIKQLSFLQIQLIGLTQALALIPGCSRSGSTIMGGLMVGLNREAAARFSFVLGLPAIFGSGLYELKELMEIGISSDQYINLILGILAAFVVGYLSIELLLSFIRNHGTLVFVIYRILLGTGILIFLE